MKNVKQRGTVLLVIIFIVTAVGIAVVAGVTFAGAVATNESKSEKKTQTTYLVDGAIQLATSDLANGRFRLGTTAVYYVGGRAITITAVDNRDNVDNSVVLQVSGSVNGMPIADSQLVLFTAIPVDCVWSYGLYSDSTLTYVSGTRVRGKVFVRQTPNILAKIGKVTKRLKVGTTTTDIDVLTIDGLTISGVSPFTFPYLDSDAYQAASYTVLSGDRVITSYTMPARNACIMVKGNLTLHGNITGTGTFYATGNVVIDGTIAAHDGHLLVIAGKDMTFSNGNGALNARGFFFAEGAMNINSQLRVRGALAASSIAATSKFNVDYDHWLADRSINGVSLHAPSMWP
jgi:hypothetical protein